MPHQCSGIPPQGPFGHVGNGRAVPQHPPLQKINGTCEPQVDQSHFAAVIWIWLSKTPASTPLAILLRVMTLLLCFGAAGILIFALDKIMLSTTSVVVLNFFNDFNQYSFFVCANIIAGAHNFMTLISSSADDASVGCIQIIIWLYVAVGDVIMGMLLAAANSGALTIILLQRSGSLQVSCSGSIPIMKLCNQATIAIIVSFVGMLTTFFLLLYNIFIFIVALFTLYDIVHASDQENA